MNIRTLSLFVIFAVVGTAAYGQKTEDPVTNLTRELKAHTPSQWLVRVRWREERLLASITPLPYDTAFQLWYEPEKLHQILVDLCPKAEEQIWTLIAAGQDVVLEPTVGGKSGVEAQVSCRSAMAAQRGGS
jgi:hypothetical protein